MPTPSLRTYRPGDRAGFESLVRDVHTEFGFVYDPELDADLDDPEGFYSYILLLVRDDEVLGSAALTEPSAGVVTLKRMYLRPWVRGDGWGRRLLDGVIERAMRDGCERIELDTSTRQEGARRLYESSGFELTRQDGETLFYCKELRA
jgi:putative acetyltransferase